MELMTARLGVRWIQRTDGQGWEIEGVTPEQITEFSSRRVEVTERLAELVTAYERRHGYPPNARMTFRLAQQATKDTKTAKRKGEEAPTAAQELEQWERQTTEAEIDSLTQIPGRSLFQVDSQDLGKAAEDLGKVDMDRVIKAALADAQKEKSTFTRWEMTRHISRYLPACLGGLDAAQVRQLLDEMTEEALSPSKTGTARVLRLNIPDVVEIPSSLMRDGTWSVFRSPSAERWTTPEQLEDERRFLTAAAQTDAVAVDADAAADRIIIPPTSSLSGMDAVGSDLDGSGSTVDEFDSILDHEESAPTFIDGLGEDQAEAVYGILTSGRRIDVMEGYAGTGKSYTVSKLATLWREMTGGRVVGLTTAQNAAQVLKDEGLDNAFNIARWLQHGGRLQRGQLVVVDEASMVTTEHMVQIQQAADRAGAKILLTGDSEQLAAPGAGGLMRQLVDEHGSFKLTKVFRFHAQWEKDASVRLRAGDEDVLSVYDQQGRLRGGTREEMETQACEAYLADHLAGKQSLLLAATNAKAHELAGRVRDALVQIGRVSDTRTVKVRGGNSVGAGDLITARENSRSITVEIGGAQRELTNRDRFVVTSVFDDGQVRARLLDKGGEPGEAVKLPAWYVGQNVELAYAGTVNASQGRTVDTCHAVVESGMSRQGLYVEMSRGREGNWAWVVTDIESADLRPEETFGSTLDETTSEADETVAIPETEGIEDAPNVDQEHDAQEPAPGLEPVGIDEVSVADTAPVVADGRPATPDRTESETDRDAVGVLAEILETDQADQTAIETLRLEADRVNHMAHLGSMWTTIVKDDLADQTSKELAAQLPEEIHAKLDRDPARGSVITAVRQAVIAGHDLREVITRAAAESWEGARSIGQTLTGRIEQIIGTGDTEITTWSAVTPQLANGEMDAFARNVAEHMDQRVQYLGERAAQDPPAYLIERLGEVPEEIMARLEWQQRAGKAEAYREQYGNEREQTNILGSAPDRHSPEQRASWFAAARALGQTKLEQAVSAARDGALWVQRAAYERAARWAPVHMGDDLRQAITERDDRSREGVRLRAQAEAEQDEQIRASLNAKARAAEDLSYAAADRCRQLERLQKQREAWVEATEDMRQAAMLADAELHRRHDNLDLPPLHGLSEQEQARAAEPEPEVDSRDEVIDGQEALFGIEDAGPVRRGGLTERPEPEVEEPQYEQPELDLDLGEAPVTEGDTRLRRALEQARAAKHFVWGLAWKKPVSLEELGRDAGEEPTRQERSREDRYRDDLGRREEAELERRRSELEKAAPERTQDRQRTAERPPPSPPPSHRPSPTIERGGYGRSL
jgi:hypothetical protein